MPFPKVLFLLPVFAAICSCKHTSRQHAFYYWKTSFNDANDSITKQRIKNFGITHFYIRYLDVDWSENLSIPVPKAELEHYGATEYTTGTYTPVVFITNRTFEHIQDVWIDSLAAKLTRKIASLSSSIEEQAISNLAYTIKGETPYSEQLMDSLRKIAVEKRKNANTEIQIDCDWTPATKDKYFRFLQKFHALNPDKTLSATIRLYPYKYQKTMGVPPVQKGVLMCYNLGNIRSRSTENSIFDIDEMEKYLDGSTYPFPLDIALPIFSWQVWFRGEKFMGIIHDKIVPDSSTKAFTKLADNSFRINTDTVIADAYYREGDIFRVEKPEEGALSKATKMLTKKIPACQRVIFFDWDPISIKEYEETIQDIFDSN